MRRPTFIILIVLFVLLIGAGIAQLVIASGDGAPLEGPASPGQLPSLSLSPPPERSTSYSRTTVLPSDRPSVSAALPSLTTSAS